MLKIAGIKSTKSFFIILIFQRNNLSLHSLKSKKNMATYKKKGFKKNKKKGDDLSYLNKESTTAEVFTSLDEGASKMEKFLEKNQKWIFTGLLAVIVLVAGYMWYDSNVIKPKEKEAINNLVTAQEYFDKAINETEDEAKIKEYFDKALNGVPK